MTKPGSKKLLLRAARTIAKYGMSGCTAIAGKCVGEAAWGSSLPIYERGFALLPRDETPPSSRVGALARRIEGEPGRIGSASKEGALRYAAFGGYSG